MVKRPVAPLPTRKVKQPETVPVEEVKLVDLMSKSGDAFQLPDGKAVDINSYLVWLGNQILALRGEVEY